MTYGIGGYGNMGMMGGMYSGGMYSAGMGGGNMNQYFKSKYGCEDCFRTTPYMQEYPKPIMPVAKESIQPSFGQRLFNKIIGG